MKRIALAVAGLVLASSAWAVDTTGEWGVCISGGGGPFGCPNPAGFSAPLVSATGQFSLDLSFQAGTPCILSGTVDSGTGVMTLDDVTPGCAPFILGFTGTATDTTITGTLTLFGCFAYTIGGAKACGTCDDGNVCTIDGCGTTPCSAPSSSCTIAFPDGRACDPTNGCLLNGTCYQGECTGSQMVCNDHNPCTNDSCDPGTGDCVFTPNSAPCSDGSACTVGDTCSGGTCVSGPEQECGPCENCSTAGCVVAPATGCRLSTSPERSKLIVKDGADDTKDKLSWTWAAGEATAAADFGDPVGTDDYTLCIYDGVSAPTPRLFVEAAAPAGGACTGGTSCWKPKGTPPGSKGFLYKDSAILLPDGLKNVKLQPGASGRAKVKVKGQGPNLALPSPMNVTLPVVVQLRAQNGRCFESTFTAAQVDQEDLFRAKASQ
jgi:hypothetical protein